MRHPRLARPLFFVFAAKHSFVCLSDQVICIASTLPGDHAARCAELHRFQTVIPRIADAQRADDLLQGAGFRLANRLISVGQSNAKLIAAKASNNITLSDILDQIAAT